MSLSPRSYRRGAVLPLVVIVLALMAVAVAISYARISAERAIAADSQAHVGAFAIAQSGLNRFLSTLNAKPAGPMSATYADLPGGTAQVELRMLRESTNTLLPAVYSISSRGFYTAAKRFDSRSPAAERMVGTFALWVPAPLDVNGAFTSLSQVEINGNSANVNGNDRCGAQATIPGLATPDGDISLIDHPPIINGNPEDAADNLGTPGTGGTAKDEVQIDWASVEAGTAFPADYVYTGAWPTAGQFANWPVVRVNGDLNMPGSGKGILIVTGNLTWNGTPLKTWEGLILVGGTLTANGQGNIYGALITALDVKTGTPVGLNDVGNGTKNYWYDSCALARALGHIGSIQRVRNGWTDTWSSY
jgi:hypothetical protein